LVHISELAWHRIDHPREVVRVGDEIEVYVLKIDKEEQRISLSRKKLLPNPWDTVEERYEVNQLVEGKITRIVEYGAFAEIEPGIEGLLHVSQLSRGQVDNPNEVVNEKETHLLRIVSIDSDRQRIGLSLRQVSASEQIEWMAQKQAEAAEAAEAESEEEEVSAEAAEEEGVEAAEAVSDAETASADEVTETATNADETEAAEEETTSSKEEAAEVVEEESVAPEETAEDESEEDEAASDEADENESSIEEATEEE